MMLVIGSLILAVFNCYSLWLISHHRPIAGWGVMLGTQALWLPYDVITHQWGFLVIAGVTIVTALKSIHKVKESKCSDSPSSPSSESAQA